MEENFDWILKIINSCKNDFHFEAVKILIDLFNTKHKNSAFTWGLKEAQTKRWNEIHGIVQ